jgi:hypothetical protein
LQLIHFSKSFSCFRRGIRLVSQKIHNGGNSDRVKQGWAKVLVSAVSTYGGLLKDEELEFRVIALEEKLKNSILIPKPHDDRTAEPKPPEHIDTLQ